MKIKTFFVLTIVFVALIACSEQKIKQYDDGVFFGQIKSDPSSFVDYYINKAEYQKDEELKKYSSQIEKIRKIIKQVGLDQEVPLVPLFLLIQSGAGMVMFRWKCINGSQYNTQLPIQNIEYNITEQEASVKFIFKTESFYAKNYKNDFYSFLRNPGLLVLPENVFLATISISEEDMEKYLSFR